MLRCDQVFAARMRVMRLNLLGSYPQRAAAICCLRVEGVWGVIVGKKQSQPVWGWLCFGFVYPA